MRFLVLLAALLVPVVATAQPAPGAPLVKSRNLGDVPSPATARTNLGLGTIATQAASSVAITGGTIDGTAIGGTTSAAGIFLAVNAWSPKFAAQNGATIVAGGSGYAVADLLTLAGGTCSTPTVIAVAAITGGAVSNATVVNPGVCSIAPTGTLSVASTTGTGTGATFTVQYSPGSLPASTGTLSNNGGNTFLGAEQSTTYSGTEGTFLGDRAGGAVKSGSFLTLVGHNAGGIGGSCTITNANNDTALGTDALRNWCGGTGLTAIGASALYVYTATGATNITAIGTSSMELLNAGNGANSSTAVGSASCHGSGSRASPTGNFYQGTCLGANTGGAVTTGSNFLLLGYGVGNSTLASGSGVILVGSGKVTVDTPAGNTSNYINIENVYTVTGTNTPSTSVTTIAGVFNAVGVYQANGTAGVTCSGSPTASFASTNGIITHC